MLFLFLFKQLFSDDIKQAADTTTRNLFIYGDRTGVTFHTDWFYVIWLDFLIGYIL